MVDATVRTFTKSTYEKKNCLFLIRDLDELFLSWYDNSKISIKDLRLKVITLLSLYCNVMTTGHRHWVNYSQGQVRETAKCYFSLD